MIRSLLLDVDGTLIDSKRDIAEAQLWVLEKLGVRGMTAEDIYPLIGSPLTETFAKILPPELHDRIPEAKRMYIAHYRPRALDTTTLFPGVEETLAALHARKIAMAVATTKSTVTAERVLKHFGIVHYLAPILGTDDTPPKPDPYIANRVIRERGWSKETTMLVGDSPVDVACARNAGIRVCAVSYGSLTRDAVVKLQPDAIIDAFPQILRIVDEDRSGV